MEHLVYCDKLLKELEKIINQTQTLIVRGAAGRKLPYGRVFENENLYFIENNGSGLIRAKAKVKSVFNSDKLTEEESIKLINERKTELGLKENQTSRFSGKKYLCIVEIENVEEITPLELVHQKNMDDWITGENINNITNGSNEKYQSLRLR